MADKAKAVNVEGFSFENAAEAAQAKKEVEGIKYIKARISRDDPEKMLEIYNKMVGQKLFETAVGYGYLKDMQEYLLSVPAIPREKVLPIPVIHPQFAASVTHAAANGGKEGKLKASMRLNAALIVCIIAMFAITMTSGSPTIVNYRTKVLNQYAEWEQELSEREQAVREKEQELGIETETGE